MKKVKIAYYIVTVLLSAFILLGAFFDVSGAKEAKDIMIHLGYPVYVLYIVGWAKILGIIGIWQPKVYFLREWAYAGLMIDVVGALISHLAIGDSASMYAPAVLGIILVTASYVLFRKTHPQAVVKTV
jgi:hypothetical protein